MKYLLSPLQLGALLESDDREKRKEIIDNILSLFYIKETNDKIDLDDHIKINELIRKELHKKRWYK